MNTTDNIRRIERHVHVLCEEIGARPPGSAAKRHATDYLHDVLLSAGVDVGGQPFSTRYWVPGDGTLTLPDGAVPVAPNPFSRACDVRGRVVRLDARDGLHDDDSLRGSVLVLGGELSREQVMPKGFPFFNPTEHQQLVAFLERHEPAAVVAIWPSDAAAAPVFEDADVTFPSTTVPPSIGARLVEGAQVAVRLAGAVHDGDGVNVVARAGGAGSAIVLSAHIDSKITTPGALDNAGSVAVLLALAEAGLPAVGPIELVFFNGEDHYSVPGELAYLAATDLAAIRLNVNLDAAGFIGRPSTIAALACPAAVEERLAAFVADRAGWSVAEPWPESDHSIFAMQGVPALAITSENVHDLFFNLTHTPDDTVDKLDPAVLADVAAFLVDWLETLRDDGLLG